MNWKRRWTFVKKTEDELRRLNAELKREISERKQAVNAVNEQELAMIFENEKSALPWIIIPCISAQHISKKIGLS